MNALVGQKAKVIRLLRWLSSHITACDRVREDAADFAGSGDRGHLWR